MLLRTQLNLKRQLWLWYDYWYCTELSLTSWPAWTNAMLNFSQDHFCQNNLYLKQNITCGILCYTAEYITCGIYICRILHLAVWLCSGSSLPFHVPTWKAYRQGEHSSLPFHVPTWRGLRQGERRTPPRTTPGTLPSVSYMEMPVRGASSADILLLFDLYLRNNNGHSRSLCRL